jgi:hypothetical protein
MTKILKAVPFGSARGERQNRVKSVECLDGESLSLGRQTASLNATLESVNRYIAAQARDIET